MKSLARYRQSFTARLAAWRLAARRAGRVRARASASRIGGRVAMRWRRTPRPTFPSRSLRPALPSQFWAPHVHFHFAAAERVAATSRPSSRRKISAMRETTALRTARDARTRTTAAPSVAPRDHARPAPSMTVVHTLRRAVDASRRNEQANRAVAERNVSPVASFTDQARYTMLPAPPRTMNPVFAATSRKRPSSAVSMDIARTHAERSVAPHSMRPVSLTWRNGGDDARETRLGGAGPDIPFDGSGAQPTTIRQDAASTVQSGNRQRVATAESPAAVAETDAAATDRLVENVIRRIEKRARIERERSGI